jgi:hypothetical protein
LDTPDEQGGTTKRKQYLNVEEQTGTTPPPLLDEIKPEPHEECLIDMFFEMYHPEQNLYVVLDAYCRLWGLELDGEDITLLQMLWRTAESHRIKNQKEKLDKSKKKSKGSSPSKPAHRPVRKGR